MAAKRLVVVSAGLGQPSSTRLLADRLATATHRQLAETGTEVATDTIELRDHAHDLTNNLLTGFPAPRLRDAIGAVLASDGLIAVTPIFSASYTGLFKMFFDVLERDALSGKPVLIAATGGTPRHSLALEHVVRPLFAYFNASTVPTAVFAAAEDWGHGADGPHPGLVDRIDRAATELAAALVARTTARAADPFEEPVPFEELLRSTAGTAASQATDRQDD